MSIGTGVSSLKTFGKGIADVLKALKAIAIESEEKAQNFQRDFPSLRTGGVFFRFNVTQGLNRIGLEDASRLGDIDAYTDYYCHLAPVVDQMELCSRLLGAQFGKFNIATL